MQEHELAVRASDADRQAAVETLREHFFAGRLDVEEFTERVEQAYAARTVGDLQAVERELPVASALAVPRKKPWLLPGNESFAVRIHTRKSPQVAIDDVMRDGFTRLTGVGYLLQEDELTRRVFVRSRQPPWTVVAAVVLFPLGLLALMYRERSEVVARATAVDGGLTAVDVYGTAPLPVRRAIRDRAMADAD